MDPITILALITDLYAQVQQLTRDNQALASRLQEQENGTTASAS